MMYYLQYKFPHVFYTQTFGFRWYDFDILQKKYNFVTNNNP